MSDHTAGLPATGAGATVPLRVDDQARIDRALQDAKAPATRRAYQGAWRSWANWAARHGHLALPAEPVAVAAYLAERAETAAPATVRMDRAGIAAAHREAGAADPASHPGVKEVLAGLARRGADRGRGQVLAVDWRAADLAAALAANGGDYLAGLRDGALIAAMSDALLRVSEASALNVADMQRAEDGSGTLTILRSKTDQQARGHVRYLGASTVVRIGAYLDRAGHHDGPLFRRVYRGDKPAPGRLSARSIRTIITRRAAAAGVTGHVSGHSLRIGAAQSLAAAGAGLVELQQAGDWDSPTMPARYTRHQAAARGAVAKLRYGGAGQ